MATTGTNIFTVTRDDIIKASLRVLGVIGVGETPITEDYENCSQALNIMIKSWSKKGLPLWVTQDVLVPTVVGVNAYVLGPTAAGAGSVVMSKPLRVIEAFIRTSDGQDTPLETLSRQEYLQHSQKTIPGIPNQFYYDVAEPNGTLYVYNTPISATDEIHLQIQRQFFDMTTGTDNFDFPQEWFQALKWGLAAELSIEYGIDIQLISYYEQKAATTLVDCFDASVEEASVYFSVREN